MARNWCNLRWETHANRANLFFASDAARLTPVDGKAPCLYLASSEKTSFLEIYGDKICRDREAGRSPVIAASDFIRRVFLQISTPDLLVADLTQGQSLEDIHLDLGTLYAADPVFPRMFARAIFDHPANVDGIVYESRHTKEPCIVIWHAHTPNLADIPFTLMGNLSSYTSLSGGTATLFDHDVVVGS